MRAYHGTEMGKAKRLIKIIGEKKINFPGLYVTDTMERAIRYAYAQTTRKVDATVTELPEHGAVIVLEIPEREWKRRADDHNTLDVCETSVNNEDEIKIIEVIKKRCGYWNCTCQKE